MIRQEAPSSSGEFPNTLKLFSSLSKDIVVYGVGGVLGKGLSYLTAPILARLLAVPEFGVTDIIASTVGLLTLLLSFNLNSGLWRYFYEIDKEDVEEKRRLISSILWLVFGLTLAILGLSFFFIDQLTLLIFDSLEYQDVLRIALFTIPLQLFGEYFVSFQRMERRPGVYSSLSVGKGVLNFGLTFAFLYYFEWGVAGVYWAQIISFSIVMIIALWLGRNYVGFSLSRFWVRQVAKYALPEFPAVLINWFLAYANRFFLVQYAGIAEVGYLAAANKVAGLLLFFTLAFRLAWDPFALSHVNTKGNQQIYTRGLDYYVYLASLLSVGLLLFSGELLLILVSEKYLVATSLIVFLVFRYLLQGANNILAISIAVSKKTIFSVIVLGCAAVITIIGNMILTPLYGVLGAVVAELIGFLAATVFYYLVSQHLYAVPWNLKKPFTLTLVGLSVWGISLAVLQIFTPGVLSYFLIRVLLFVLFGFLLYALLGATEKKFVKAFSVSVYDRLNFTKAKQPHG